MPIAECNDFEQVIVGCKDMHLQIIYKIIFPVKKQLYTLFHLEMHLPFSMECTSLLVQGNHQYIYDLFS